MDAYVSHVPPPMWVYRTNIPKTRNMSEREVSCALAPQSQQPFRDFITFRCQYVSALDAEIPEHVKQTVLQYLPLLNGFVCHFSGINNLTYMHLIKDFTTLL